MRNILLAMLLSGLSFSSKATEYSQIEGEKRIQEYVTAVKLALTGFRTFSCDDEKVYNLHGSLVNLKNVLYLRACLRSIALQT